MDRTFLILKKGKIIPRQCIPFSSKVQSLKEKGKVFPQTKFGSQKVHQTGAYLWFP